MDRPCRAGLSVEVEVPASSANLGPGFDSVGLALGLWDRCVATVTPDAGLVVEVAGEGAGQLPRDERHLVHRSMVQAWSDLGVQPPQGLRLQCRNAVPHGRGLGSSATAIVTGVVAAQALHDAGRGVSAPVDLAFANDLAARLEGHPDNSSASVFGGLTLSWFDDARGRTSTLALRVHPDVVPVLLVPSAQLSTATARAVLPTQVRHGDAALNSARAALLVQALTDHPAYLLAATREWLHQEARRSAYAASMALVDRLRSAGHAAVVSGAGPSVLVLSTHQLAGQVTRLGPPGWQVLRPGIPLEGARTRVVCRP